MLLVEMKLNRLISTISINDFDGNHETSIVEAFAYCKISSLYLAIDSEGDALFLK